MQITSVNGYLAWRLSLKFYANKFQHTLPQFLVLGHFRTYWTRIWSFTWTIKKFKKCWINYSTGRKKCFYGQDLTRRSCITHPWSNSFPDLILTKLFTWVYFVPLISDFWLGQKRTYEIESSLQWSKSGFRGIFLFECNLNLSSRTFCHCN